MAEILSIYCPHCHRHTALTPAPVEYEHAYQKYTTRAFWQKSSGTTWWIGVCNACDEPVLVLNKGNKVYPAPLPKPTEKDIPELIRTDLNEAKICFSAGAYRASAVMARRAMQVASLEKGATGDKLVSQIAQLQQNGKITTDLKEWADAVRWVGNDAAHPNGVQVTKDDAEDVLHLAEQFLHVLYVAPALAAGIKKRLGKT
ncbi:MAG: DUF4145 domain-containing protein [Gammaproteobacteria bacterium]|nr:MAG: DUF4145 domain-containing protein [Gammaproteobacteria bacterium]